MKETITIEIDEDTRTITLRFKDKVVNLQGLAIIGSNAQLGEVFIELLGSSSDAAWAYAQGFIIAQSRDMGKGLTNFYKQCAAHICQSINPDAFKNMIDAQEAVAEEVVDAKQWN